MNDDEARRLIARELSVDAEAFDRGAPKEIGSGFRAFLEYLSPDHRDGWKDHGLGAAYTFWDRWIDARNHEWRHYPHMVAADWPIVARQVAATLLAGDDPSPLVQERTG
jgi:hypothetical protein